MAIGEAQSHVVIEHSVHVFDPKSVDGPIEYSPLFVLALAAGTNTQDLGCEAVSPLVSELETIRADHEFHVLTKNTKKINTKPTVRKTK